MTIAVFDYAAWSALYPQLAVTVDETQAGLLFQQAGLILNNTDASPVTDAARRLVLLNMLVAHLAALGGAGSAGGYTGVGTGTVGRVKRAREGDVEVETDVGALQTGEAWYATTPYGWAYWQATRGYRTMHYRPGPRPVFEPYLAGRARRLGGW